MPQDAITLRKTAKELNILLSGAKVNKITQPIADEIVINLYSKTGNVKLPGLGMHIQKEVLF